MTFCPKRDILQPERNADKKAHLAFPTATKHHPLNASTPQRSHSLPTPLPWQCAPTFIEALDVIYYTQFHCYSHTKCFYVFALLLDKYADKCFISGVPHTNILCTSCITKRTVYIKENFLSTPKSYSLKKTFDALSKRIKIFYS